MVYHVYVVNLIGPFCMRSVISSISCLFIVSFLNVAVHAQTTVVEYKPKVVSTIWPLHLIASEIMGDDGSAQALIGVNDSAHHFNLTPSDRIAISEADVLLWIDPAFEVQLDPLFRDLSDDISVITASKLADIQTRMFEEGILDPHLWLDSDNASVIAEALAVQLAAISPQSSDAFHSRASDLSARLDQLEPEFRELSARDSGNFFVYHDAFGYFEDKLGYQHIGAFVPDPDAEPSIRHLMNLRQNASLSGLSCVLVEPDFSEDLVSTVFPNRQPNLVVIDMLGHDIQPRAGAYAEFITGLINSFRACIAPGQ